VKPAQSKGNRAGRVTISRSNPQIPAFESFEKRFSKHLSLYGTAGSSADQKTRALAQAALARLKKNPSLRVLAGPDGPVLYEDPLLDSAWTCMELAQRGGFGFAAEGDDLDEHWYHWLSLGTALLRARFKRNWDVLKSATPSKDVNLKLPARIAIFGDAGYRGLAQRRVLEMIANRHKETSFDAVIHLGDTYHGGNESEMFHHLVAPLRDLATKFDLKVYSLCGNHDLYAGPDGYLDTLKAFGQPGRFFALEMPSWRLACLDSTLGDTSRLYMNGKLDAGQLGWLQNKQKQNKRLVVLSHHLPRSAWDATRGPLLGQIGKIPGLVAWYWGHEHRCAAYGSRKGANFLGGCVGNGAFLEKWTRPTSASAEKLEWYPSDARCTCFGEQGKRKWPHGFLELELREDGGTERFHVENAEGPSFTRNLT
jgi:Calcineurin-like phosphoesterase